MEPSSGMTSKTLSALLALALARSLSAQFTPMFFQNAKLLGRRQIGNRFLPGRFLVMARCIRCELMIILTPEFVDPTSFGADDDRKKAGRASGNQNALSLRPFRAAWFSEQRSITAIWRFRFDVAFARLAATGTDGFRRYRQSCLRDARARFREMEIFL